MQRRHAAERGYRIASRSWKRVKPRVTSNALENNAALGVKELPATLTVLHTLAIQAALNFTSTHTNVISRSVRTGNGKRLHRLRREPAPQPAVVSAARDEERAHVAATRGGVRENTAMTTKSSTARRSC